MEKKHTLILGAGIFICAVLVFIDIYLGAVGAVILVALAMSFFIMEDSRDLPDVTVTLREDAKGIVLTNRGNATAYKIHVAIVPINIEFDVASLAPETSFESPVESMINEVKAIVEFEGAKGARCTRTYSLSALGKSDDDLLKPMFPIFRWK